MVLFIIEYAKENACRLQGLNRTPAARRKCTAARMTKDGGRMREYGEKLKDFLKLNREEIFRTHRELCLIPAPSHFEDERAKYCRELFESFGARGVYIDGAKNVVFPMNCEVQQKHL